LKHIFTIHSHITFLAAIATIAKEEINTSKVILICTDGYKPRLNNQFKGVILKSLDDKWISLNFFQKIKSFNYTNFANSYINDLTNGADFIAYIDIMSVFNRYLVLHPNCKQFNVIEEGIVNYADYDDFMLWTADLRQFQWQWTGFKAIKQMLNACIRLMRGRSLRLLAMPVHPNLYTLHKDVIAYCFSDFAFQYTPTNQKKVLDWNSIEKYVPIEETGYNDASWFWIGDAMCSSYGISMLHFESALKQLLEKINPNRQERIIYLKFRGAESKEEKELTLQYLSQYNFKIENVPSDVIMELLFLKYKNLNICGIGSSLLIYANLMGHATHSLYSYIPIEYGISLNKSYQTISKKVGFI
jgi:hypothetical protein